ncbi:MAG: ABC transporter ATP-binding protein/permease [Oscillospiraceae bacterium]|nr:ABC transporter ATP-binding protein/permease [Oscillospiraceae bacterium]
MFKLAKRYLGAVKKEIIIGQTSKLIEAIFEVIVPLIMAAIVDNGINGGRGKPYIYKMGGLLVLLGVLGLCFALICQYLASKASQSVGTVLRNDMFRRINSLSHAELDRLGTPSLITRLTNDINQVQQAVAMYIRLVVRAPFIVIGSAIMAVSIDLKLSVVFVFVIPLVVLVLYLIMSRSIKYYKVIQKKLDRISLVTREGLSGVRVIRAFSRQETEQERFDEANDEYLRISLSVGRLSALLNPLTYAVLNLAIAAIVWFGGFRVNIGDLTQGEVIAFVNYMTQISLALVVVANLVVLFTKAAASASRINEVLDIEPSIKGGGYKGGSDNGPAVKFDNVSFSYNGSGENALENISFTAEKGETIGIIGGTGSGKSTLVSLIPRFYDVTDGSISVCGTDVREYDTKALRNMIGTVPQKAVLFSGTIAENMRWGKADATEEEIRSAIKTAQAEEFVNKMPNGLETKISQGGKNLSGGQKQRLTIARALVSKPQILILDDSASALDFATDAALRKAIARDTENMTVFIVSQRANSIRQADKIIVLDDGKQVGIGTHKELLEGCEVYREICYSQLSREEAEQ